MSFIKRLCTALVLPALFPVVSMSAEEHLTPTATCVYAERDATSLLLDIYAPSTGSVTMVDGRQKPTVLFVFGGAFKEGQRDTQYYKHWFRMLTDAGYPVVSIDYRLGMKDYQGKTASMAFVRSLRAAIDMAVDDLYSATEWLLEHGADYGIDARNMVVSGSSAGAITVMQAEYELANRTERSTVLPSDFNYAGVLSFAGAIYTYHCGPKYSGEPCPTALFHGTDDHIVPYGKISIGRLFFGGAKPLAKTFKKHGFNYNAYRYTGHGHEIATNMVLSFPEEVRFLETNVMRGQKRIVDTFVDDPDIAIPDWGNGSYKGLYN